jgi:hypothetical protein
MTQPRHRDRIGKKIAKGRKVLLPENGSSERATSPGSVEKNLLSSGDHHAAMSTFGGE